MFVDSLIQPVVYQSFISSFILSIDLLRSQVNNTIIVINSSASCFAFYQVTFLEAKECEAMKELYKVLKDHKNPFMEELVRCSYRSSFAKEMEGTGGAEILCSQDLAYYRSDIHREETTLDIDDWKILTQGGYAAHDVKYQNAQAFINRCPMLITS